MANITRRNLVIIYVFRYNIKVNINEILTDKKIFNKYHINIDYYLLY